MFARRATGESGPIGPRRLAVSVRCGPQASRSRPDLCGPQKGMGAQGDQFSNKKVLLGRRKSDQVFTWASSWIHLGLSRPVSVRYLLPQAYVGTSTEIATADHRETTGAPSPLSA